MRKLLLRNICLASFTLISSIFFIPNNICIAENMEVDWFNVIPELNDEEIANVNTQIKKVWSEWGRVRDNYNKAASGMSIAEQMTSWIMNRNTIMNYLVFVVQFLSQLWIAIWVVFIIYAWYVYMTSALPWGKAPSSTVKNAIIWVIIIIFSYAIMRFLLSIIWMV